MPNETAWSGGTISVRIPSGGYQVPDRRIPHVDTTRSPERTYQLPSYRAMAHLHFYNPNRRLSLEIDGIPRRVFDITDQEAAQHAQGWTGKIASESYWEIGQRGYYGNDLFSFDVYGTTADWLDVHRSDIMYTMKKQVQQSGNFPVGDPYIHRIMPHGTDNERRMRFRHGKIVYRKRWGVDPRLMWLPEAAVDQATLESMAKEGIYGVLLREHQVAPPHRSAGYSLYTESGPVAVMVSNESISGSIGYERPHAGHLSLKIVDDARRLGYVPRLSTDSETFGHHWRTEQQVWEFMHWFNKHLREFVNAGLINPEIRPESLMPGILIGNTSWSCRDDGLGRWEGSPNCSCDLSHDPHLAQQVRESKRDLHDKTRVFQRRIEEELGGQYPELDATGLPQWMNEYIDWRMQRSEAIAKGEPITVRTSERTLHGFWFPVLVALEHAGVSCGTFFGDPGSIERQAGRSALAAAATLTGWDDLMPIAA